MNQHHRELTAATPRRSNEPVDSAAYLQSVIPHARLDYLASLCEETLRAVPGNVLEVGVYRGGSLARLADVVRRISPKNRVYGIDTFSGHPYTDGHPVHPVGKYADIDLDTLVGSLTRYELAPWITLIQGRVEDVLPTTSIGSISFAHVDCDLYWPVLYCARELPARMQPGGIIYFDDYGHEHCPGATAAVRDVFSVDRLTEVYIREDCTCWSCFIRF
jgi:O-methyltransferase